jgi:hypothetical protein
LGVWLTLFFLPQILELFHRAGVRGLASERLHGADKRACMVDVGWATPDSGEMVPNADRFKGLRSSAAQEPAEFVSPDTKDSWR